MNILYAINRFIFVERQHGRNDDGKITSAPKFPINEYFLNRLGWTSCESRACTDYTSALHSFTYGSKGLADKDNVAVYSRIIAPTCSEYWSVHCLPTSSRPLYLEATCEDSHAPGPGTHLLMIVIYTVSFKINIPVTIKSTSKITKM